MTSPDGITWTTAKTPDENNWVSVAWSPEQARFVAVASSGGNHWVIYSLDGRRWKSVFTGKNYTYADPTNLPTHAIYGNGANSSGTLTYTGATTGGSFYDTLLKWKRIIFSLKNKFTQGVEEPVFLKVTGTITGTANKRAARALLSLYVKRWLVGANSTRLTTVEPPTVKPINAYWRYRTPRGVAPYWSYTNNIRLVYALRSPKYEEPTAEMTKCVLLMSPMPLLGKRSNNNTAVSSTANLSAELWQIKKGPTWQIIIATNTQGVPCSTWYVLTGFSYQEVIDKAVAMGPSIANSFKACHLSGYTFTGEMYWLPVAPNYTILYQHLVDPPMEYAIVLYWPPTKIV
jgi:hypothetical protein